MSTPVEYNLTELSNLMVGAYTDVLGYIKPPPTQGDVTLDTKILNEMLGYPDTFPANSQNFNNTGEVRTLNFFIFWNKDDQNGDYFTDLGTIFSTNIAQLDTHLPPPPNNFYQTNIFVTYILVFAFTGILSSPDGVNLSTPLDIFTPDSNRTRYSRAAKNLSVFLSNSRGLGNVPIYASSNTQPSPQTIWNTGYVSEFCNIEFKKYCVSQTLEINSQKCISGFRTKLANSTTGIDWCGCFAPLPNFISTALASVPHKHTCDSLCYRVGGIKLYNIPGDSNGNSPPGAFKCDNSQVCIIDNNNINANNSEAAITFNQICKCRNKQACLCYVETSTPGLLDNVANNEGQGMTSSVIYNQECTNSVCFTVDPITGVENEVECNPVNAGRTGDTFLNSASGKATVENYEKIDSTFWIFVSFFMVILLMYQFSYLEIKLS